MDHHPTRTGEDEVKCDRCNGTGYHKGNKPYAHRLDPDDLWDYMVPCLQPGCHNGEVDVEEYYRQWQHLEGKR